MADIEKTVTQINGILLAANPLVGTVASLITSFAAIIRRREAAGEDVADFKTEIERFSVALARVEQKNADYWSLPPRPPANG